MTLFCGIIYLLMIPSIFIFLPIYMYANLNDVSWGTRSGPQSKNTSNGFFSSLKNLRFSGLRDVWRYILDGPQVQDEKDSGAENPACEETDNSDSDLTDSSDANVTEFKLSEDQDTLYSQYAVFGGVTVGNLRRLKRKQRRRMQSAPTEAVTEAIPSPIPGDTRRKSMVSNFSFHRELSEPDQLMVKYNLRKLKILTKPVEETNPIPGLRPEQNRMIYSWIPKGSLTLYSDLAISPYDIEHRESNRDGSDLYSWITDDTSAISEVSVQNLHFKILNQDADRTITSVLQTSE